MIHPVDTILSLALLSILFSFGSSRLPGLIKVMAFQGVVVSIVVPFSSATRCPPAAWCFTIVTLTIRGIVIPGCIYLAIKKSPSHARWNPSSATMPPSWPACC
jgi:hydrogenase-4 component E